MDRFVLKRVPFSQSSIVDSTCCCVATGFNFSRNKSQWQCCRYIRSSNIIHNAHLDNHNLIIIVWLDLLSSEVTILIFFVLNVFTKLVCTPWLSPPFIDIKITPVHDTFTLHTVWYQDLDAAWQAFFALVEISTNRYAIFRVDVNRQSKWIYS